MSNKLYNSPVTPGAAAIELTRRCNFRCAHCSFVRTLPDDLSPFRELTRRQVLRVVDGLADVGVPCVRLYGGEPYLRRDADDILRYIARRGMRAVLDTNGTLLTSRRAALLADLAVERIELPLFGATAASYELVTGVKGSFGLFRRGLELLQRRGLPLQLRAVPAGPSSDGAALAWFAENLGVPVVVERAAHRRRLAATPEGDWSASRVAVGTR